MNPFDIFYVILNISVFIVSWGMFGTWVDGVIGWLIFQFAFVPYYMAVRLHRTLDE